MQIRLLYRSPLAPTDVELGHLCDVEDDVGRDLIRAGEAELPNAVPPLAVTAPADPSADPSAQADAGAADPAAATSSTGKTPKFT